MAVRRIQAATGWIFGSLLSYLIVLNADGTRTIPTSFVLAQHSTAQHERRVSHHVRVSPPPPKPPPALNNTRSRQIPLTLDQSVHAPPPSMHFSGSVHSTRSASSTLKSAVTDRSMETGEDEAAAAVAFAGGGGPVLGRRRQLDAVRNRVSTASLSILEHYAETTGRRLADVLQASGSGWSFV